MQIEFPLYTYDFFLCLVRECICKITSYGLPAVAEYMAYKDMCGITDDI